jgi:hypothetical protein
MDGADPAEVRERRTALKTRYSIPEERNEPCGS